MNPEEKEIGLKVVSALAWADDTVTQEEHERLVEFIAYAGDLDPELVSDTLNHCKSLDAEVLGQIEAFTPGVLAQVLSFGFDMVNAERPAVPKEIEMLERVCAAGLGSERWEDVLRWLRLQREANALYDRLFSEEVTS